MSIPYSKDRQQAADSANDRTARRTESAAGRDESAGFSASSADEREPRLSPLMEKKRRELLLYLSVSIAAIEMLLLVGCIFYGFMSGGTRGDVSFPWLVWGSFAIILPAVILLAVHQADVGLFRRSGQSSDHDWQKHLPERMRRIYKIIKGAPAAVVLLGIVALGAALLTLDEALSLLRDLGSAVRPHIPIVVGGLAAVVVITIMAMAWLSYRTRKLYAEYAFRREILEKTGVIIVDKDSSALPPGDGSVSPYAVLEAGAPPETDPKALTAQAGDDGEVIDADAREVETRI